MFSTYGENPELDDAAAAAAANPNSPAPSDKTSRLSGAFPS